MPYSLSLALACGLLALGLTPAVMALARRVGALDHPSPRRIHREPVPTMGGLAFAVSVLGVAWLARLLPGPARELDVRPLLGLTLAAIPMLALGIVDDLRGVDPWSKLAVQAGSAAVLVQFGYSVPLLTNPFGAPIAAGLLSGPLAVLWVMIVVNAINLIDGLDGLASGVVLIAAATLWWVGHSHADFYVMFLASLLIGSTLGFLRWNFPPARVFMGDTGSHFLGLTLAAASLLENRKETAAATLLLPLVAMGVPIADGLRSLLRRAGSGRHVFQADTGHIHHRLLRLGLSPRAALFVLWGLCAVFGLAAVFLAALPRGLALLVVVSLALLLFVAFEFLEVFGRDARDRRR
jgi:UDP-GlcNAc:undecaprenyl-phosphate GlcNAc-1-phosphate transferase